MLVIIAAVSLLTACGGDEHQDLKAELNNITKSLRPRIEPLPVVKPYEPVPYLASDLPDPFSVAKYELAFMPGKKGKGGGANAPDTTRPKEPLESYPFESLKMVGSLSQGGVNYALINAGGSLYRVKVGNHMGQNFGIITAISDSKIDLKELVLDQYGDWTERKVALQLLEAQAATGR